ncbi:MAG TPA: endo alpha-1,4 polygalactosaminidase [Thermotogota bacterium]|nr:endo alpha-1,4 polygalactosaminidase [Thermotogota bacterium]
MRKQTVLFLLLIPLILISCNSTTFTTVQATIKDFVYAINGAEISDILNTTFDLAIIDYSRDGTEDEKYTSAQIQSLKNNDTIPIAYFSIGEAEDYRYYWQDSWNSNPPSWLGEENPDWEGNYKVRYWQRGWKTIMFDYLDKILALGFEGVMLDIIDAYYYWSEEEGEVSTQFAATEMIDFVCEIYTYAVSKTGNSHFKVFPQNAVEILDYDTTGKYLSHITGLSIESLFYEDDKQTNSQDRGYRLEYLERYKDAGKLILVTDYIYPDMTQINDFYSKTKALGFIPYAADRSTALDSVITIPNLQPSKN